MATTTTAELNIYQKLALIKKQVEVLKKDKAGYGYTYTTEENILSRISTTMEKLHLSLIPRIVPGTMKAAPHFYLKTKTTRQGDIYEEHVNEVLVSADMMWTWIDNDNPENMLEVPWTMVGQQSDASQAFGSALTYTTRYFLLKFFNVATSDDPDEYRSKQKAAEAEEDLNITKDIVSTIDSTVRSFIAENNDKAPDIKAICCKYVKNGDYKKIRESMLAGKLLEDLNEYIVAASENAVEKE